ncbi:MAG: chromosomal replication initiator protein DnaA, partial [Myxococcales bacterium]|nr:chromosomal replication initiator protein DnaA [Myxococcales bacterium]
IILKVLKALSGREFTVQFTSGGQKGNDSDRGRTIGGEGTTSPTVISDSQLPLGEARPGISSGSAETDSMRSVTPARPDHDQLDFSPHYRFDTFVVGPSNQFAHAACQAVAESPARNYNPLFIYGGVGLGKTHLLQAIGNYIRLRKPSMRIKYISSESYINELIHCIRNDRMDDFRRRYRAHCDVLLIDDIQFIAGKDRTQEEFFHTFNSLYSSNKQIVVTSDRVPQDMPGLEERLRTRFQWGLIADIQAPEVETRIAILEKKAERESIRLPEDVAMFLATNIKSNVRELEGSLIRLNAYATLIGADIQLPMAKNVLKDLLNESSKTISSEKIIRDVANFTDLKVADLKGPRRHKMVALPRMIAMYLCRELTSDSYPELGRKFGNRDHSTVINAVNKVEKLLVEDPSVQKMVHQLRALIIQSN